jgi:acyl-CoA synthetase (AMP-forming)/AMP-acid ligase II
MWWRVLWGRHSDCRHRNARRMWAGTSGRDLDLGSKRLYRLLEQCQRHGRNFRCHTGGGPSRRYLRTGDLGLFQGKQLFVTGRRKETIIIRGVNYYPADLEQEIEEACADLVHGTCAAFCSSDRGGRAVGDRHRGPTPSRASRSDCPPSELAVHLAETHGINPAAVFVVAPHALPRTSSGKLQRLACLRGVQQGEIAVLDTWYRLTAEASPQVLEATTST